MMPGGRPKTPTNKLKLHGGLNKTRHADRAHEPQPEGDAVMLAELTGPALELWKHLHPQLSYLGLATELDSAELTAMCDFWGDYSRYKADREMNEYRRLQLKVMAYKQFRSIAPKFGLTPGDRASLGKVAKTIDDELGSLIA